MICTCLTLAMMDSCRATFMMGSLVPVDIQSGTVLGPSCGTEYLHSMHEGERFGRSPHAEPQQRFVTHRQLSGDFASAVSPTEWKQQNAAGTA